MKLREILTILCCICLLSCNIRRIEPDKTFVKFYGGPYDQQNTGVFPLAGNGFVLFGSTSSTSEGNHSDAYMVKTNAGGLEEWSLNLGEGGNDVINDLAFAPNQDGYVLLSTREDQAGDPSIFLSRTDLGGQLLWDSAYSLLINWVIGSDIIHTSDRGYLIIGTRGEKNATSDSSSVFILKVDERGERQWRKFMFTGPNTQGIKAFENQSGYVVLAQTETPAGQPSVRVFALDKSGNLTDVVVMDEEPWRAADMVMLPDGGLMVLCTRVKTENFYGDIELIRLNNDLTIIDNIPVIPGSQLKANRLHLGISGSWFIGGTEIDAKGNSLMLLTRLNPDASLEWRVPAKFGFADEKEVGVNVLSGIYENSDGTIIVAGTITFGNNTMMSLIKTNSTGELKP